MLESCWRRRRGEKACGGVAARIGQLCRCDGTMGPLLVLRSLAGHRTPAPGRSRCAGSAATRSRRPAPSARSCLERCAVAACRRQTRHPSHLGHDRLGAAVRTGETDHRQQDAVRRPQALRSELAASCAARQATALRLLHRRATPGSAGVGRSRPGRTKWRSRSDQLCRRAA